MGSGQDNGKKHMQGHFKDGNLDGSYTDWHSNGFKENEGQYKDGKEQ